MSCVFVLVEGKSTETKVYPALFQQFAPKIERVERPELAREGTYYQFSAKGYPAIVERAAEVIQTLNAKHHQFTHLLVCADSDNDSPEKRIHKFKQRLDKEGIILRESCRLVYCIQHPCIETWFLGNKRMCPAAPTDGGPFLRYYNFYNVGQNDPELMPADPNADLDLVDYHYWYLKEMLSARSPKLTYTKDHPGAVIQPHYLSELLNRVNEPNNPPHLPHLRHVIQTLQAL